MEIVSINKLEKSEVNKQVIEQLAQVLTYLEPENFGDCVKWWEGWFSDKMPGDKFTFIAEVQNNIIGVVRFWKTPFCNNKWLIEGLEVIPPERKKGVGRSIITGGIHILRDSAIEKIYVHISDKNIPSIKLHEVIGFKKIKSGVINSYGDFRGHVSEYVLDL
ncbi:GNAT family N-acetyltransferase [Clostridium sp. YIM B02515]|uniref:GNAT family N-acetyltransferase n=1 Tax=Clostridium rhizosphaerae TaxID=2803861 RepID=A0ABS1TBV3_9CLOT|nr:GNAT family N-acetyltransferase [Clostridium rhizosphaerae]MBL4936839.1 GNAT family N-acetyltransferase [Clostridium rhizosphaerae]